MVHGDVRASNFLVNEQQEVKLGDFGLAKKRVSNVTIEFVNTRYVTKKPWLAPELFGKSSVSFASDVYSFGMVMWELMTGYEPFSSGKGMLVSPDKLDTVIREGKALSHHVLPSDTPDWLHAIFTACLAKEPSERPTMGEIVQVLCCAVDPEKYQRLYPGRKLASSSAWLQNTLSLAQTTSVLSNPKIALPTTTTLLRIQRRLPLQHGSFPLILQLTLVPLLHLHKPARCFRCIHPGNHSKATDKDENVLSDPEQVEKISNEAKSKIDSNQ